MRRISKYTIIAALVLITVVSLGGCGKRGKKVPDPKSPVVITSLIPISPKNVPNRNG